MDCQWNVYVVKPLVSSLSQVNIPIPVPASSSSADVKSRGGPVSASTDLKDKAATLSALQSLLNAYIALGDKANMASVAQKMSALI